MANPANAADRLPLPHDPSRRERNASLALLLATVFWGCGFTWAKAAADAVHGGLGLSHGAAFGPLFILALRFLVAAGLIFACLPAARRGWGWASVGRVGWVGVWLTAGLALQHLGLDLTTEAVSAFLTSLTILFVPLLVTLALWRPPAPVLWLGVFMAAGGIWLMTGATPAGFGLGELLGLSCALAFSLYILAVNSAAAREDPWRLAAGQFFTVGFLCALACLFLPHGPSAPAVFKLIAHRPIWLNTLLLVAFSTLVSFTLLNFFQPRIDPTRAALIYLIEPIFGAAYAWLITGRGLGQAGLAGAALILVANVIVELYSRRREQRELNKPIPS